MRTFLEVKHLSIISLANIKVYLPTPTFESVCLSVCLFFRSITQKRMIPKCSNLVYEMILGYPRSNTVLGFKGQRSRSQGQWHYTALHFEPQSRFFHTRQVAILTTATRRGFVLYEYILVILLFEERVSDHMKCS